jgi:hypothetical protein
MGAGGKTRLRPRNPWLRREGRFSVLSRYELLRESSPDSQYGVSNLTRQFSDENLEKIHATLLWEVLGDERYGRVLLLSVSRCLQRSGW